MALLQHNNFKPFISPGVLTLDPEMQTEKHLYILRHPGDVTVDNSAIQDTLRELCRSDPLSLAPFIAAPLLPPFDLF